MEAAQGQGQGRGQGSVKRETGNSAIGRATMGDPGTEVYRKKEQLSSKEALEQAEAFESVGVNAPHLKEGSQQVQPVGVAQEGEGILQCMREERPPGSDVLEEPQNWPKSLPPSGKLDKTVPPHDGKQAPEMWSARMER
ncbi:unnamed protein product [Haemonchus placei]|uniref:GAGE domain-containing protein n=1 Tax=Haemonchus placei TaxID=6290 RepID=A0A0N4W3S8_HAEPC|nr:unnamed protein product [Haemonchus placei]